MFFQIHMGMEPTSELNESFRVWLCNLHSCLLVGIQKSLEIYIIDRLTSLEVYLLRVTIDAEWVYLSLLIWQEYEWNATTTKLLVHNY